jgi:exodeoxyribonuclease-3
MKIGSINVNGLNAFCTTRMPGAWDLLKEYRPDILCIQETKCNVEKLWKCMGDQLWMYKYKPYVNSSKFKPGYAGVAMLVDEELTDYKIDAIEPIDNIIFHYQNEYNQFKTYGTGRILKYEDKDRIIVTVYTVNSGNKDDLRMMWDIEFRKFILNLQGAKPVYILGDLNVVAGWQDIWVDWDKRDQSMPGLKHYENQGFMSLLNDLNLTDTFRHFHPDERKYSWSAPKVPRSKGWRLDYALTDNIKTVKSSEIHNHIICSDHSYIEIEIE